MIQKDLLWCPWNVWLSYYVPEGEKKEGHFNDALRKYHEIRSLADMVCIIT